MAQKKPLALYPDTGRVEELRTGDTLSGAASGGLLTEYTDSDPASPSVGEQWLRLNTGELLCYGFFGAMPVYTQVPDSVQLSIQTSAGVKRVEL